MSIVGFPWRSRFATIFRRPGPEAYAAMLKRAQRLGPTLPPDRKLAPKAGPACPLSREQRQSTGSRARAPTELGYSVVGPTGHEGRQAPRLLPNRGECTTRRIFSPPPQRHGCVVTAAAAALLLLEQGWKKRKNYHDTTTTLCGGGKGRDPVPFIHSQWHNHDQRR